MDKLSLSIKLPNESYQALKTMAQESDLALESLSSLLLQSFVQHGGKIFVGKWKEGGGLRVLPDWPRFSSGVLKVTQADLD